MSRDTARFHITFPDGRCVVMTPEEYRWHPPASYHSIRVISVVREAKS